MMENMKWSVTLAVIILALFALCASGCSKKGDSVNTKPAAEEFEKPVAVIDSPAEEITIRVGETLHFEGSASSGEPPYTYEWNFGFVAPASRDEDPGDITFDIEKGNYFITLMVTDHNGELGSDVVTVHVVDNVLPVASITSPSDNPNILVGDHLNFQGTVVTGDAPYTYRWDFGDAAPDAFDEDPGDIIFSEPGSYEISFTVTDRDGESSTARRRVNVTSSTPPDIPLAASISYSSPTGSTVVNPGSTITFLPSVSTGNPPYAYLWTLPDGSTSSNETQSFTFSTAGTHTISLQVTDFDSDRVNLNISVTVLSNLVPVARIITPPVAPAADNIKRMTVPLGSTIFFQGTGSSGDGQLSYVWDFSGLAEGAYGNSCNATFTAIGTNPIIFSATDSDADTSERDRGYDFIEVTVTGYDSFPHATIPSPNDVTTVPANETIRFQGSVSYGNAPYTYAWTIDGGAPVSTVINPDLVFPVAGTYVVSFRVQDIDGDIDETSRVITVVEP